MSQADLARASGLATAEVAQIEDGERGISASELVAVTSALGVPTDWFFTEPPPAVVSRRRDPAVGGFSRRLDLALDLVARDVAFLVDQGILAGPSRKPYRLPGSLQESEELARVVRAEIGWQDGPLADLQLAAEGLGLLAFSLDLGRDSGDAACVEVGQFGVAVINGRTDPGRRRFSLAHELGHHLAGDAYEPSPRLGASDGERMINAFAAHLLMPRPAVFGVWEEISGHSHRQAAIAMAVLFSVSWTAACNQLVNLDLIDHRERERLIANPVRKGELFEFGERFVRELEPPSVPPGYARLVVGAYREGQLSAPKAVALLHDSVSEPDLPEQQPESLDDLLQGFDLDL